MSGQRVVYMDNNATTKAAPEVVAAMLPFFGEYYGNPSSMHNFGGQVGARVDTAPGLRWPSSWAPRQRRSCSPPAAPRATTPP